MIRSCFLILASCVLAVVLFFPAGRAGGAEQRPNVIFFLIDDLGWTDVACNGSGLYETPNIDRLAAEGMRFTDAYAACTVCSPTRAACLSGKYPARLHLTDWIEGHRRKNARLLIPDWTKYLPLEEVLISEVLKEQGYTTATIGKWHLGNEPYYPQHQGFDLNVAGDRWGAPANHFWPYARVENGKPVGRKVPIDGGEPGEYLSDRLTDEAIAFINRTKGKPFFLYFPHYAVHTPLQAKRELVEYYEKKLAAKENKGGQRCATYAAMVHSMDESVGRVMRELERLGIAEKTILFFTGDNGGLVLKHGQCGNPITCNAPLREGKGSSYEGGVRVPLVVKWPGVTEPGSVSAEPVITNDYFATIVEMTGASPTPRHETDGESLVPLLKQDAQSLARDALYWHYPHYHPGGATPYGAIRERDNKLIEFYEDGRVELYNLKEDIGETNDMSKEQPELAGRLQKKLHAWREAVGAQMPEVNPEYEPETQPAGQAVWIR